MKSYDIEKSHFRYVASSNAWMTIRLFNQWIQEFNDEMESHKRKILLILDNALCHKISNCSEVNYNHFYSFHMAHDRKQFAKINGVKQELYFPKRILRHITY